MGMTYEAAGCVPMACQCMHGGGSSSSPRAGRNFCILIPFENIFYKKTYTKTFAENRPFLGVLGHDAEV